MRGRPSVSIFVLDAIGQWENAWRERADAAVWRIQPSFATGQWRQQTFEAPPSVGLLRVPSARIHGRAVATDTGESICSEFGSSPSTAARGIIICILSVAHIHEEQSLSDRTGGRIHRCKYASCPRSFPSPARIVGQPLSRMGCISAAECEPWARRGEARMVVAEERPFEAAWRARSLDYALGHALLAGRSRFELAGQSEC